MVGTYSSRSRYGQLICIYSPSSKTSSVLLYAISLNKTASNHNSLMLSLWCSAMQMMISCIARISLVIFLCTWWEGSQPYTASLSTVIENGVSLCAIVHAELTKIFDILWSLIYFLVRYSADMLRKMFQVQT